ncbi:hypothetical protein [Mycolicibacterium brisbanense]|uniref:ESX-1 secretion-associated protein n=1 Tax=Mycolicibacterium brisbanense TaxID=146020 RepID=A0A100W1M4_9MYCO|nr:hypothetical protein [Mycolicibacterium brisbanense]MCV7159864.1 hypothetical protein [Mycolicibacterium brisbanense]GAS89962.1 uncharacterized protein RMCB_4058 [Mycolicibacterium brisbanense]
MFADTDLIRALGSAYATHAADLTAAAALVRSADTPASALGPVGADFLAALRTALADHSAAITALGVHARAASVSAAGTAADFDAVGRRAADLLPRV